MATVSRKRRYQFSNADRHLISKLAKDNPGWTQAQVTVEASKQLGVPDLKRSSIAGILKDSAKWLQADVAESDSKRQRLGQWDHLEKVLFEWYRQTIARNAVVSDKILLAKASDLALKLEITNFKGSDGWLMRFKHRHRIRLAKPPAEPRTIDGEATSAVPRAIEELGYKKEDVFTFDETGLFFRARPSRTVAAGSAEGEEMQADRITVALATNVTGTDRLKPVIINNLLRPRAFGKSWKPTELCDWFANSRAGMTPKVFTAWLTSVNQTMSTASRQILILMDSADSHAFTAEADRSAIHGLRCITLSHVRVVLLPKDTPSSVQPLDAAIIAAFKCHYRRQLLSWLLQELQADTSRDLHEVLPNVKQAIFWTVQAWEQVSSQSIANCWMRSGILPAAWNAELRASTSDELEQEALAHTATDLARMITQLDDRDQMSAAEYIQLEGEDEAEGALTDEELIQLVQGEPEDEEREEEDDDSEAEEIVPCPSLAEVRDQLKGLLAFVCENTNFSSEDQLAVAQISSKVSRMIVAKLAHKKQKTSQRSIMSYFSPS